MAECSSLLTDHFETLVRALCDAEEAANKLGAVDVCIELRDLLADVKANGA